MSDVNLWVLSGRLTRDPAIRHTGTGTPVANFSVRHSKVFGSGDAQSRKVHFFDVVMFGKIAETVAEHFKENDYIILEGEAQQEKWETTEGTKRSKVSFLANSFRFPPRKPKGVDFVADRPTSTSESTDALDDDPPF